MPIPRPNSITGTRACVWGLGRGNPDLHSDDRNSSIYDWKEHEDRGPSVQQPSETAAESTPGGGIRKTAILLFPVLGQFLALLHDGLPELLILGIN